MLFLSHPTHRWYPCAEGPQICISLNPPSPHLGPRVMLPQGQGSKSGEDIFPKIEVRFAAVDFVPRPLAEWTEGESGFEKKPD